MNEGIPERVRVGTMISEFGHPAMPRVLAAAGFEFAIVDCEHGAFDTETVAAMSAVAAGAGCDLWVRTPSISRDYVGRYLDLGARGIVAPMIDSVAQAEQLVRATRYPPLGARGISVTRAHAGYRVDSLVDYLEAANVTTQVYAQIETRQALTEVERIAAVEGLTGLIVGPNDLLADLGYAGEYGHPELKAAITRIVSAAVEKGKSAGIITGERGLIDAALKTGANFVSVNSDVGFLLRGARNQLNELAR